MGLMQRLSAHSRPNPLTRNAPVVGGNRVADRQHMMGHHRSGTNQSLSQSQTITGRPSAVLLTVDNQNRDAIQALWEITAEWGQRPEQDRPAEQARMGQQQGSRHNCTVGEADDYGPSGETVTGAARFDEFGQDRHSGRNVCLIHPAIWKAAEEGIAIVDGDSPSDAKLRHPWRQFVGQWHEIEFAATGPMEQNQRRTGGVGARKEAVCVSRVGHTSKASGLVSDELTLELIGEFVTHGFGDGIDLPRSRWLTVGSFPPRPVLVRRRRNCAGLTFGAAVGARDSGAVEKTAREFWAKMVPLATSWAEPIILDDPLIDIRAARPRRPPPPLNQLSANIEEAMTAIRHVEVPNYPSPHSPYSHATVANGLVFVSGQIPVSPDGDPTDVVGDTMHEQTRQALRNVEMILKAAGSSLDRVIKITVLLARPDLYREMNEAYEEFFPGPKPARTMARFGADIPHVLVAIDAIALA